MEGGCETLLIQQIFGPALFISLEIDPMVQEFMNLRPRLNLNLRLRLRLLLAPGRRASPTAGTVSTATPLVAGAHSLRAAMLLPAYALTQGWPAAAAAAVAAAFLPPLHARFLTSGLVLGRRAVAVRIVARGGRRVAGAAVPAADRPGRGDKTAQGDDGQDHDGEQIGVVTHGELLRNSGSS